MDDDDVMIKSEVDPNDQEDMEPFPIREEMVLVDVHIKEEDLEPFKNPLPGPNTLHQGFPGQNIMPGNVMGDVGFNNFPLTEEKMLPDDSVSSDDLLGENTTAAAKQFGSRTFKSGPAGRRKASRTAEEAECEPSTTSGKRRACASKSAGGSGFSPKATSSKQVQDLDNDVDSNNGDELDDEDEEDEDVDEEEDPEDSNPPSMDDNSTSEPYQPKTRTIPIYKDTNSTHSDLRICHRNYTRETLRAALEAVKTRKISMRKAAKDFGVPCSTISRLAKEANPFKRRGRGPLLTEEEEDDLIRWIRDRSEMGFRVTPSILRDHVQRIMIDKPGPCLSKNGIPGRKWFTKFIARHPEISILKPEPKEPVKKAPKEKPKPEMKDNEDRVSLGDTAMFGMSAFFEQSLLEERAFERSLNERRIITYRDPNAGSLTLSDFESAVGRELMGQLRNEGHAETRSEEFQALHRLWRLFPANSQNNSSMS